MAILSDNSHRALALATFYNLAAAAAAAAAQQLVPLGVQDHWCC